MTELTLNYPKQELLKNLIAQLLEQLTIDYKNTKVERQQLAAMIPASQEEFTLLEELELLTVDIRGYGSQIKARGWIDNEREAIDKLQAMGVFEVPAIAQFYLTSQGEYEQIKAYIRMLDYLRLLVLEYLRSHPKANSAEARMT